MKLNLPNRLTVIRLIMAPALMVIIAFDFGLGAWGRIIAAALFALASLTDMLDGKIARKYGLITDFGKFLDPLADKFMVLAALVSLVYVTDADLYGKLLFFAAGIVIFRELAVTSMRLVVAGSKEKIVVAANILGKIKTCTQIAFILWALTEQALNMWFDINIFEYHIIAYVLMAAMTVMTVWSGLNYILSYWKYLDPQK